MQKINKKMAAHNELGKAGEDEAATYLLTKGYQILHRNWHYRKKELDIVARKENTLVVVEVKTRSTDQYGNPEEAVTDKKIRNIIASTDVYLKRFGIDLPVQFDIITVIGIPPHTHIEHIEEAFLPPIW